MTQAEAVSLTLEVWTELRDNPHLTSKATTKAYPKIEGLLNKCPLCQINYKVLETPYGSRVDCTNCPLYLESGKDCDEEDSFYQMWVNAYFAPNPKLDREEGATGIVDALKAWQKKNLPTTDEALLKEVMDEDYQEKLRMALDPNAYTVKERCQLLGIPTSLENGDE